MRNTKTISEGKGKKMLLVTPNEKYSETKVQNINNTIWSVSIKNNCLWIQGKDATLWFYQSVDGKNIDVTLWKGTEMKSDVKVYNFDKNTKGEQDNKVVLQATA